MKIEREKLLNDLQDFASRGDGVIIGSPGVGKTYALKELRQRLKSSEIPHLLLRIDQLGNGAAETLREELSYEGDLIEKLKSIPVSGKSAILLFDAFDAARDEQTRKRFLTLIRRAIRELVKWNVVVTVRTYDAMKSQELLDLFGNPDDTKYQSADILCRHFTIPPFNENEILEALEQIGCPEPIYNEGSQDFKNMLAIPFNLWLLRKILKSSDEVPDFSQIRSEVQLLNLFWQRRIENENSEHLLRQIADKMVQRRSLSIRIDEIYDTVELDKPVRKIAWDQLQSDGILSKVSSTGQRIAFSHNILFDYAISVLLIDDEPRYLKDFILEDASRPLFLRPSLTYFFTRLWYYDSASFWRAFWHIFPSDQSVHLRLVARLIPTSVIANEAHGIKQLEPLLEKLQDDKKKELANEAVMRLLQSLQTLPVKRPVPWIDFFDRVSEYLDDKFAWDLANLTSDILEQANESQNSEVVDTCGRIGRRLLGWVWKKRKASEGDWYNRIGGYWAVPLVAETYNTNVYESRTLLKKALELTKKKKFPIGFLSSLTKHVDNIWDHDSKFVILIYDTVFSHQFIGDGETRLGGAVLPITTSRRQDFKMCQYRLIKHFPNFLRAKPLEGTQAAIRSLNAFIYLREGVTVQDLNKAFDFRGKRACFVEDSSYIWDARSSSDEPIEMADALFEFLAELARTEESLPLLDSLLDIFRDEAVVAFFWKRLLKTASQFPKAFAPRLFELCIAKPIQMSLETRYELGLFLKAAAPVFTSEQLYQIEKSILELPQQIEDDSKALVTQRNRLLAAIPLNLLQTDNAKKISEKMARENRVPKNRPPVSFTTWSEPVTEEKWLQTQGVDTTAPENLKLQPLSGPLNKFSSDWLNDVPTQAAIRLVLPQLQEVYTHLKSDTGADQEIHNLLWGKLTGCVAILGRIADGLDSDVFTFSRQILLEAAKHEQPKPDPIRDAQFDHPGYSPLPRHEASRGLLRFAFHQLDPEILEAIEILANDPVPSVRMVTVMELSLVYVKAPDRFWRIMDNRAIHERNRVVQKFLYSTLRVVAREVVARENEDKITRIMAKILEHTPPTAEGLDPSDSFTVLLVWLRIDRQNSWAFKTIEDTYFKDPVKFAKPLSRAVSEVVRNYILPKHLETDGGRRRAKRAIKWLEQVIDLASNKIKELYRIVKEDDAEENIKKLHDTYNVIDEVITRLYFAVAYKRDQSEKAVGEISNDLRLDYYNEVKPLMQQVIAFARDPVSGIMFAPTAHYFMQLLRSFLDCNPKEVLHLATGVVESSEQFEYTLDSIAVRDVVEFVEILLADYRHEVREGEALDDLLNLLDMFAKIGWSDALKLVWRLDEVFR